MEVLVAVKQAEVDLLRQKLAQMSSDFSRNLAVSTCPAGCLCCAYPTTAPAQSLTQLCFAAEGNGCEGR